MPVKTILSEIENEVIDVKNRDFTYLETRIVPNRNDASLTYESGKDKKGKVIETCVLFVDMRNSVALTQRHHRLTMGKIYTAFTKAVLKLAKYHGGHTRNIIGDRVMIVFPTDNCFVNAIDCAISINHISSKVIDKQFNVDFKCGIGIDYGKLHVIKVGIQRNGNENGENKGLVWVGHPANLASRLTDVANKTVEEKYFNVKWYPINPKHVNPFLQNIFNIQQTSYHSLNEPLFSDKVVEKKMTSDEFTNLIYCDDNGKISLSENVFKGYKKERPNSKDIKNNWWKEQKFPIKNINTKVYDSNLTWDIS